MTTLTYTDTLEVHTCPTCGIRYAIPKEWDKKNLEHGRNWWCPKGCSVGYTGKTEAEKERAKRKEVEAELERTSRRLTQAQQAKHTAERQAAARKGQVTKIKNSVKNGKCPCCRRNFSNLQKHMKVVHPEFGNEEEK